MSKNLFFFVVLVGFLVGGFFVLNNYIYEEKQGEMTTSRDGGYLGFIHALTDEARRMDFDDATWLSGVAGQDAAIRAGLCTEETRAECLPNDYFIENTTPVDESVAIDTNALVFMQTWRMEETGQVMEREIGLYDFAALINDSSAHWSNLPYRITIQNDAVVRIEEVYVP